MRAIRNLEIHLAHACNLACESCSHYSNQGHKGVVTLEEAERWMSGWDRRIQPQVFSLLGGEPTINPELPRFMEAARRHWPRAALQLVTNGFFLHRHPTLPLAMKKDPNATLCLSIHHDAPEYREHLAPIMDLVSDDRNPRQSWEMCPSKYCPQLYPACSDGELEAFFAREEESFCGMCAARPPRLELPIPMRIHRG